MSKITIAPLHFTNAHISALVSGLQREGKVVICTEDFAESKCSLFQSLRINFSVEKAETLGKVLAKLVRQYPALTWECEDGVIIIRPKKLLVLKPGPLHEKLSPFTFNGTIEDLRNWLSTELPDLNPAWVEGARKDPHVYHLEFTHESSLREALLQLSRDYGVHWDVLVMKSTAAPKDFFRSRLILLFAPPPSDRPRVIDCDQ